MPMPDETRDALKSLLDQEEDRRRKRIDLLRWKFDDEHESLTDEERLDLIALIIRNPETETTGLFEKLVSQLTFLDRVIDPENLRTAWKDFLNAGVLPQEWDSKCDYVLARSFEQLGKTIHSVSVYEYMLSQMIGGDPDYRDYAEECLFGLFEHFFESKPSRRAREILTLITTYYETGFISDDRYYAVLPKETELSCREIGEVVDRDRNLAEERLRLEMMETFDRLHAITRSHLIDAELWSNDRMRNLEPSAGPFRWALAIEAEFHYKVYEPHKSEIAAALGRSASPPKTCGPRDISDLLKLFRSGKLAGNVISKVFKGLIGNSALASIDNLDALEVICEHRNQIAHVTTLGPYTLERCNSFMKEIKKSEWVFTFLSSLQPIRAR